MLKIREKKHSGIYFINIIIFFGKFSKIQLKNNLLIVQSQRKQIKERFSKVCKNCQ